MKEIILYIMCAYVGKIILIIILIICFLNLYEKIKNIEKLNF